MDDEASYIVRTSVRDRLRNQAHNLMRKEIKAGRLLPASAHKCVDCGKPAKGYDHRDYRKPLDIQPVCIGCNNRRGPGLPLITDGDLLQHKTLFRRKYKKSGHLWSGIESGEGFSPLEYQCHVNVADYECWWLDDDIRSNDLRPIWRYAADRWSFFKIHDPYTLDDSLVNI